MAAWLSSFILGRPGYEVSFEVQPEAMNVTEQSLVSLNRNLAGDLKKSVFRQGIPTVTINASYLTINQRNQFMSLIGLSDTFLSFQIRDDLVNNEQDTSTDTTHVTLQNNSIIRLDKLLNTGGFSTIITVTGVYTSAVMGGSGTNYYTSGSYARSTGIITLGSALAGANTVVYIYYTYTGWLVNLDTLNWQAQGGWSDRLSYSFQLTAA